APEAEVQVRHRLAVAVVDEQRVGQAAARVEGEERARVADDAAERRAFLPVAREGQRHRAYEVVRAVVVGRLRRFGRQRAVAGEARHLPGEGVQVREGIG